MDGVPLLATCSIIFLVEIRYGLRYRGLNINDASVDRGGSGALVLDCPRGYEPNENRAEIAREPVRKTIDSMYWRGQVSCLLCYDRLAIADLTFSGTTASDHVRP